jgi:Transposase and inactivated derivatives
MLPLTAKNRIFVRNEPTDLRKGFDGLSSLVTICFDQSVTSGDYFAFFNRPRDRIKILFWDTDGLAIFYKRLEKGRFPRRKEGGVLIDRREFLMLMEGVVPKRMSRRYRC